jgi:hypothetical protein
LLRGDIGRTRIGRPHDGVPDDRLIKRHSAIRIVQYRFQAGSERHRVLTGCRFAVLFQVKPKAIRM